MNTHIGRHKVLGAKFVEYLFTFHVFRLKYIHSQFRVQ